VSRASPVADPGSPPESFIRCPTALPEARRCVGSRSSGTGGHQGGARAGDAPRERAEACLFPRTRGGHPHPGDEAHAPEGPTGARPCRLPLRACYQPIRDTLCGTKALSRAHYELIARNRSYFGDFDPFGDFDLILGAAKANMKIVEIPVRYAARTYGATNISRFKHGWRLLKMSWLALLRLKLR
jgi:hypothetical protein